MKEPPIVLHPNGFLQYTLPSGHRMHVWHPDMPQAQKVYTPIHDHTFAFESRIILGELVETVYDWTPLEGGHPAGPDGQHPGPEDYMLWAAADAILNPTITFGTLTVREVFHYEVGDRYRRGAGVFHKTEAGGDGHCTTVMRKLLTGQTPFPYVAIPVGVRPDNEFRRDQYDGKVLWPLVKPSLDYLYGLYGNSVSTPEGRFAVLTGREDSVL